MSSYAEALADLEARIPTRMAPDLGRITDLAHHLGDPQRSYPSVHITGTNGKTSTARMVTALFGSLGIQAGTYTSPHLQSVRERIRVAGEPISEAQFAELHGAVAPVADLLDIEREAGADHVTYFELLTAMAYWWFADHPVEVGVFEVGMGGTWDATNLVRGEVAVISGIDVDHRELGSTPAEVAVEKAGIIKPGATVVVAEQQPDVMEVIAGAADEAGATILRVGDEVRTTGRRLAVGGQVLAIETPSRTYTEIVVPLHGRHQADNAALAVGALHAFLGDLEKVDDDVIQQGFAAVEVPGRLEIVHRDPTVLLDGAHNPSGAARTAAAVGEEFAFRDIILVIGCLADKDVRGILGAFRDLASHVVVTRAPSTRAASPDEMEAAARELWSGTSVAVERAEDVRAAVEKASGIAGESDGVLVTGSLYTVGAARDLYVPGDAEDADRSAS